METRAPYISVDTKVGAAYISFNDGEVHETREIHPGILLDLSKEGDVLSIEFLREDVVEPLDDLCVHLNRLMR